MTPAHVEHARALIGTRWSHRGRSSKRIDCVGLVVLSLQRAGRPVEDRKIYGREPFKDGLREELQRQFGKPHHTPKVGDIGLFRGTEYPLHVVIFGDYRFGGLSMIHATNEPTVRAVAEHRFAGHWLSRYLEAYTP